MAEINIQAQIDQNWEAAQTALPSRTVVLNGFITDEKANLLIGHILLLERLSREPILLMIQSEGGQVYAGLAIYDGLKRCSVPLITVANTLCAGNALLLLLAGHKRYALVDTNIVYTTIRPNEPTAQLIVASREVLRLQALHEAIFQQHLTTLKHPNPLLQLFGAKQAGWDVKAQREFTLEEALTYKLIDAVVDRIEDIPRT